MGCGAGRDTAAGADDDVAANNGDEVTYVYATTDATRPSRPKRNRHKNVNTEAESFKIEFDG